MPLLLGLWLENLSSHKGELQIAACGTSNAESVISTTSTPHSCTLCLPMRSCYCFFIRPHLRFIGTMTAPFWTFHLLAKKYIEVNNLACRGPSTLYLTNYISSLRLMTPSPPLHKWNSEFGRLTGDQKELHYCGFSSASLSFVVRAIVWLA